MPLDNAQFISELSVDDPPGTDNLNEGDDHIRTTKRATQQSFPNVDAAVPQTAAQMAQMAIKNEANLFTQINTFGAQTLMQNGSDALPSVAFSNSPDMGMFRTAASVLGLAVAGVERFRMSVSSVQSFLQFRSIDGAAAGPGFSFTSDPTLGMYTDAADRLSFATAGARRFSVDSIKMQLEVPVRAQDGSNSEPAYAFAAGTNVGMFLKATNQLGFATSGIERMSIQGATIVTPNGVTYNIVGNSVIRKQGTTSVAGWNFQDATPVNRWQMQILTDGNNNDFGFRRLNSAGVSQGDIIRLKQSGVINFAALPTSSAGLATGDLFSAGGFVQIVL